MRAAADRCRSLVSAAVATAAGAAASSEAFLPCSSTSTSMASSIRSMPWQRCFHFHPLFSSRGLHSFAPVAAAVSTSSSSSSGDNNSTLLGSASFVAGAAAAALTFRTKPEKEEKSESSAFAPSPSPSPVATAATASTSTDDEDEDDDAQSLVNWSGTHQVRPRFPLLTPETVEELEEMISRAHREAAEAAEAGDKNSVPRRVRCVGSALSPNGLAFEQNGMISLSLLDEILEIDEERKTVRARGGARVQSVADALRLKNLTLPVYASIREQSVGGYCQAGVHGTGARIGPADEFVSWLKLVTPAEGTIELSAESEDDEERKKLFYLARVALGAFGAVAEAEIKCDPLTWLRERTTVLTREQAISQKEELVKRHRHVRFMWIPHSDAVVVVALDERRAPASAVEKVRAKAAGVKVQVEEAPSSSASASAAEDEAELEKEARAPLEALVPEARKFRAAFSSSSSSEEDDDNLDDLSPMLLRQWLLSSSPLDVEWVKRVAEAEAEHWRRRSNGGGKRGSGESENDGDGGGGSFREGWSDEMLGFDCAGAQWVLEVAMPAGSLKEQSGNEMRFMSELLARIESGGDDVGRIPAHAPIEQRWSAGSSSTLSPVSNANLPASPSSAASDGDKDDAPLHSWVGIILYLPEDEASAREWRSRVDEAFARYARIVERELAPKHGATEHWAKIEPSRYIDDDGSRTPLEEKRKELAKRFGRENVEAFAKARSRFDPHNLMGGGVVDELFPHPGPGKGK